MFWFKQHPESWELDECFKMWHFFNYVTSPGPPLKDSALCFWGPNVIEERQCFTCTISNLHRCDSGSHSSPFLIIQEDSCPNKNGSNLLCKPTGSTRSASARIFQSTALAISHPVAKYGVPAGCLSAYTKLVNVQLHPPPHTKSKTLWCCHRCLQGSTPANFF